MDSVCNLRNNTTITQYPTDSPQPPHTHLPPVQVLGQLGVLPEHVVGHVVHEPLEALAAETLLHSQLLADVTHVQKP